jgi:hypothetical protein
MNRILSLLFGFALTLLPAVAWAEGVSGYSRGNATLYFSAIAVVLIYGIHDIFHKRWLTWSSAVVIVTFLYLNLPKQ